MQVTPELRSAMREASETFSPSWALLKTSGKPNGRFDAVGIQWHSNIPYPNEGEKWTGGCYIANLGLVVAATPDGHPSLDEKAVVTLGGGQAIVVTTDKRVIGLFPEGGTLLGTKYDAASRLVFALNYRDAVSAEPVVESKTFGGTKLQGLTLYTRGSSFGAVKIVPVRGINHPWNDEKRGIWGKGVAESIWQDVVKAATGSERPGSLEPVVFTPPNDAEKTLQTVGGVLLAIHAYGLGDEAEIARTRAAIEDLAFIDVLEGVGTLGNMLAEHNAPDRESVIREELLAVVGEREVQAAAYEVGHASLLDRSPQTVVTAYESRVEGKPQPFVTEVTTQVLAAAGRVANRLKVQFNFE